MIFDFLRKKNDDIIKEPIKINDVASNQPGGGGSMVIEDIFTIRGRGKVMTGKVHGILRVGDKVVIVDREESPSQEIWTAIKGIEAFRKTLDVAQEGDNCGLLFEDEADLFDELEKGFIIKTV